MQSDRNRFCGDDVLNSDKTVITKYILIKLGKSYSGCTPLPKFPILRGGFPEDKCFKKAIKMMNICIYIVWEKGQWETGHFKMFQGRRDTLYSGKLDILPSGNDFFL